MKFLASLFQTLSRVLLLMVLVAIFQNPDGVHQDINNHPRITFMVVLIIAAFFTVAIEERQ